MEGSEEGNNRGKKGKGNQGTSKKGPWTKSKGGKIEGGEEGVDGAGECDGGKWRQLHLNNSKK